MLCRQGYYSVGNTSSDMDWKWPPSLRYGKFRATAQLLINKSQEVVTCVRSIFTLAPKLSKKRPAAR